MIKISLAYCFLCENVIYYKKEVGIRTDGK